MIMGTMIIVLARDPRFTTSLPSRDEGERSITKHERRCRGAKEIKQ
jgi:hypothetical protein